MNFDKHSVSRDISVQNTRISELMLKKRLCAGDQFLNYSPWLHLVCSVANAPICKKHTEM